MQTVIVFLTLAGLWPWLLAWRANRRTTLRFALYWALAAWIVWGVLFFRDPYSCSGDDFSFVALALTGGAGVAVLGARRPQAAAWNFVVLSLFAVLLLPILEGLVIQARTLGTLRLTFLLATLVVGIGNYLPTRFALSAMVLALACAGEAALVLTPLAAPPLLRHAAPAFLLITPWIALAMRRTIKPSRSFDVIWLDFRDRFGFVWAQRVREQFNHAAKHAGWPLTLTWTGLFSQSELTEPLRAEIDATLLAILQRFRDPPD